jgi:hypothetical protein
MTIPRHLLELLSILACCSRTTIRHVNLTSILSRALNEIAFNLLYTELPLTPAERRALTPHRRILRKLAHRKLSIKATFRLLTPRLLRALLTPVVRLLNGPKIHVGTNHSTRRP